MDNLQDKTIGIITVTITIEIKGPGEKLITIGKATIITIIIIIRISNHLIDVEITNMRTKIIKVLIIIHTIIKDNKMDGE